MYHRRLIRPMRPVGAFTRLQLHGHVCTCIGCRVHPSVRSSRLSDFQQPPRSLALTLVAGFVDGLFQGRVRIINHTLAPRRRRTRAFACVGRVHAQLHRSDEIIPLQPNLRGPYSLRRCAVMASSGKKSTRRYWRPHLETRRRRGCRRLVGSSSLVSLPARCQCP